MVGEKQQPCYACSDSSAAPYIAGERAVVIATSTSLSKVVTLVELEIVARELPNSDTKQCHRRRRRRCRKETLTS